MLDWPQRDITAVPMVTVPEEEFQVAVQTLAKLADEGAVRLLVVPALTGNVMQFRFEMRKEHAAVEQKLQEHSMTFGRFRQIADDVADALYAAAQNVPASRYARNDANREREATAEDEKAAKRKLDLVRERFPLHELRQRIWVKQTAKTKLLLSLEWDVTRRLADDGHDPPDPAVMPHATLQIQAVDRVDTPLSGFSQPIRQLTVTLDRCDIGAMIDALTRLDATLDAQSRHPYRGHHGS